MSQRIWDFKEIEAGVLCDKIASPDYTEIYMNLVIVSFKECKYTI